MKPVNHNFAGACYETRMSVRIGRCSGPEAAAVRSMFEAHGIDVMISGEHDAYATLASHDIRVRDEDAERATELLAEMRAHQPEPEPAEEEDEYERAAGESLEMRIARRKRTGVALLLACFLSFGTGHLSAGAWLRGIALAAIEIFGFTQISHDPKLAALLVLGSIVTDAVGSIFVVRKKYADQRARLPQARLRS